MPAVPLSAFPSMCWLASLARTQELNVRRLGRCLGTYLAILALALVVRVGLMFATVAGVSAYTLGPGSGGQSMSSAVSSAWAGMQDLGRVLNGSGQSDRLEIRSVLAMPSIVDGRVGVASSPRQPGRPLIIHLGN